MAPSTSWQHDYPATQHEEFEEDILIQQQLAGDAQSHRGSMSQKPANGFSHHNAQELTETQRLFFEDDSLLFTFLSNPFFKALSGVAVLVGLWSSSYAAAILIAGPIAAGMMQITAHLMSTNVMRLRGFAQWQEWRSWYAISWFVGWVYHPTFFLLGAILCYYLGRLSIWSKQKINVGSELAEIGEPRGESDGALQDNDIRPHVWFSDTVKSTSTSTAVTHTPFPYQTTSRGVRRYRNLTETERVAEQNAIPDALFGAIDPEYANSIPPDEIPIIVSDMVSMDNFVRDSINNSVRFQQGGSRATPITRYRPSTRTKSRPKTFFNSEIAVIFHLFLVSVIVYTITAILVIRAFYQIEITAKPFGFSSTTQSVLAGARSMYMEAKSYQKPFHLSTSHLVSSRPNTGSPSSGIDAGSTSVTDPRAPVTTQVSPDTPSTSKSPEEKREDTRTVSAIKTRYPRLHSEVQKCLDLIRHGTHKIEIVEKLAENAAKTILNKGDIVLTEAQLRECVSLNDYSPTESSRELAMIMNEMIEKEGSKGGKRGKRGSGFSLKRVEKNQFFKFITEGEDLKNIKTTEDLFDIISKNSHKIKSSDFSHHPVIVQLERERQQKSRKGVLGTWPKHSKMPRDFVMRMRNP